MSEIQQSDYNVFLNEVKEKIYRSQLRSMQAVNKELIELYTEIGRMIVEKQDTLGWGKSVVENLSKDLQNEFPETKGYSVQNLWYMRQFYIEYKEDEKLQPLVGEIGWTHNIILIGKCKDLLEREFYIKMTKKYGWSKSVLIHQIEGKAYECFLVNQTNFDKALEAKYKHQAKLAVKDSYIFDFLELSENYKERELELGLLNNIRKFLEEMGGDFAFIGNQYHLRVGEEDFYIDLLLYHRLLKCFVAIELKAVKFRPEFAGKMQFYLTALDELKKQPSENPSIGIIVCKTKDRTVVEFALKQTNSPMGVANYSIETTLPEDLKKYLPSPEQIIESLNNLLNEG
jgi:predicted nuclease of restriction endonuclease-like (RecB) superfamily